MEPRNSIPTTLRRPGSLMEYSSKTLRNSLCLRVLLSPRFSTNEDRNYGKEIHLPIGLFLERQGEQYSARDEHNPTFTALEHHASQIDLQITIWASDQNFSPLSTTPDPQVDPTSVEASAASWDYSKRERRRQKGI